MVVKGTNARRTRGFNELLINTARRVIVNVAFIALANVIISVRRLFKGGLDNSARGAQPACKALSYWRMFLTLLST
ncbi:hypothetical protein GCM10009720_21760 [Yaniella flava]|uniref:Uncharacterized protein n=1 Tax=Yaniella flava TaxID=287930 RepID=A0ABN2UV90_9MICC